MRSSITHRAGIDPTDRLPYAIATKLHVAEYLTINPPSAHSGRRERSTTGPDSPGLSTSASGYTTSLNGMGRLCPPDDVNEALILDYVSGIRRDRRVDMKALPSWQLLALHYPAHEASVVAAMVGGKVKVNYDTGTFSNFCAIRVSRALNLSGHQIPYIKDQVSSGSDGRWYVYRVRILMKYLEEQYGKAEVVQPAKHKSALNGRRGIIVFEVAVWSDASGHADLWDGQKCLWQGYADVASTIRFWPTS